MKVIPKISLLYCCFFITLTSHANELRQLSFMSGSWTATIDGVRVMETWSDTTGNKMIGMHKDVHDDGKTTFEYLRIEQSDNGIIYYASPAGREATPFTLKEITNERAVFENLQHDFPNRIIYTRQANEMLVRIEDTTGENGFEWRWQLTMFMPR